MPCLGAVIALCGQSQALGLALELIGEMRGRGIPRNVHTYSALMNTCIKNGELELALDVFSQLQVHFLLFPEPYKEDLG
jgi:pentatricopeptide repeat domain-containing protein 1